MPDANYAWKVQDHLSVDSCLSQVSIVKPFKNRVNLSKFYLAWELTFFYIVIQNICKFFTKSIFLWHWWVCHLRSSFEFLIGLMTSVFMIIYVVSYQNFSERSGFNFCITAGLQNIYAGMPQYFYTCNQHESLSSVQRATRVHCLPIRGKFFFPIVGVYTVWN